MGAGDARTWGEGSAKVGGARKWAVQKWGSQKWGDAEWGREERRQRGMLWRRDDAESGQEGANVAFMEVDTDATVPLSPLLCTTVCSPPPSSPPFLVALLFGPILSLHAAPFLHGTDPHISQLSLPCLLWLHVPTSPGCNATAGVIVRRAFESEFFVE